MIMLVWFFSSKYLVWFMSITYLNKQPSWIYFSTVKVLILLFLRALRAQCHEWLWNTGRKLCNLVSVVINSLGFYITSVCSVFLSWMSFLRDNQYDTHFYLSRAFCSCWSVRWQPPRGAADWYPFNSSWEMVGKNKFRTVMIMAADASRAIQ